MSRHSYPLSIVPDQDSCHHRRVHHRRVRHRHLDHGCRNLVSRPNILE